MTSEELKKASNQQLLDFFKRAIELKGGKSPFDIKQLESVILERMDSRSITVDTSRREVGDGHDEFG